MQRLSVILLAIALAGVAIPPAALAQQTVRVFVDGDRVQFDQPPVVVGSRVLVPLRGVFEKMGATVSWEPDTRTVVAVRGTTVVELVIGERVARVNNRRLALDVPPMIIRARTLVPLRFISESLGADVQWQEETRTVLVFTGQGVGGQPQPQPQPTQAAQPGELSGTLVQVHTGDGPFIVVARGGDRFRINVTPDTAISRLNTSTNSGGSVSLSALKMGDEIEATLGQDGRTATRIRASYQIAIGRLDAVTQNGRQIMLTNGQSYRINPNADVLINDQPSSMGNLRQGMIVLLRLNPRSNVVWGIEAQPAAAGVSLDRPQRPTLLTPTNNAAVSSPLEVRGTAAGANRVRITLDAMLGVRLGSTVVPVASNGEFATSMTFQTLFPGWPLVLTAVAENTNNNLESDPLTIQLRQR